ncbi:hypothetical protein AMTRI_Chr11g98390 [Amborella trichopoda]
MNPLLSLFLALCSLSLSLSFQHDYFISLYSFALSTLSLSTHALSSHSLFISLYWHLILVHSVLSSYQFEPCFFICPKCLEFSTRVSYLVIAKILKLDETDF